MFNRSNVLPHDWRNANFLNNLANQRIDSLFTIFNVATRQECVICPDFVSNQDTTIQNTDSSNEIVKVHQIFSIVSRNRRCPRMTAKGCGFNWSPQRIQKTFRRANSNPTSSSVAH